MSGMSDSDRAKEIIYRALKVLRDIALENHDQELVSEIDDIQKKVYDLETY